MIACARGAVACGRLLPGAAAHSRQALGIARAGLGMQDGERPSDVEPLTGPGWTCGPRMNPEAHRFVLNE
jgi:hypothetical protein